MVVVESGAHQVIVVGDLAVSFRELDEPQTIGQLRCAPTTPNWSCWRISTSRGDP